MLRIAIPVVAVMLALLAGVGTKAPDKPFPIYPRPGGPPRAATGIVDADSLPGGRWVYRRLASTTAERGSHTLVHLNP